MRNTRRRAAGALGAVLLLAALPACSSDSGAAAGKSAPRTYELPSRQVRKDGEVPVRNVTVRSGDLAVTVIGLTTGIKEITGSHAQFRPKGQFVRIRVVAVNAGRTTQILTIGKQKLVASDGRTYTTEQNSMLIKRQPEQSVDIGTEMRVEFDFWYDIPAAGKAAALRVVGTPELGASSDPPAADAKLPTA